MGEAYNRSMCLVNIESNERHNLNDDEYIIGRGWFNCSDQRISRNHGILKITSNETLSVISTHSNPIFYKTKENGILQIVKKDDEAILNLGDSFGLLPDSFWFDITHSDKILKFDNNDRTNPVEVESNNKSNDADIGQEEKEQNNLKRKLPTWLSSCNKKSRSDDDSSNSNITLTSVLQLNDVVDGGSSADADVSNSISSNSELVRNTAVSEDDAKDEPITDEQVLNVITTFSVENSNRPANTDELNVNNNVTEEVMQTTNDNSNELLPEATSDTFSKVIKTEPTDEPKENVNNDLNNLPSTSSAIVIKQEIKTEPNDNRTDERIVPIKNEPDSTKPTTRDCCQFGVQCYRRNPMHRLEMAHPGDIDYRLPNYEQPPYGAPPCPYGINCYRRNPTHFKQFSHPPSTDAKQNRKNYKRERRQQALKLIDYSSNANYGLDDEDISDSEEDPFADGDGSDDPDYSNNNKSPSESEDDSESEIDTQDMNTE